MKTTIELPDDLVKTIKIRAIQEDRTMKDVMAELLQLGIKAKDTGLLPRRIQFPIIKGTRPAKPGEELTPERVAEILMEDEVRHYTK